MLAIAIVYAFYWRRAWGQNLTERSAPLHAGKQFLVDKYYLDWLYTDEVVGSIKGPIAHAAYWVNQKVIDNVLNVAGKTAVASANFVYRFIDQRAVDGVYNGTAIVTGETGGLARRAQTGKVQEYALMMLFGLAAVALALAVVVH